MLVNSGAFVRSLTAAAATHTQSFDAGSSANRVMYVALAWDGSNGQSVGASAFSFAGQALTPLGAAITNGNSRLRVYRRIAPASGVNDISFTHGSGPGASSGVLLVWVEDGIDQTTPDGGLTTNSGTSDFAAPYESFITVPAAAAVRALIFHSARGSNIAAGSVTNMADVSQSASDVGTTGDTGGAVGIADSSAEVDARISWSGVTSLNAFTAAALRLNPVGGAAPVLNSSPGAATVDLSQAGSLSAAFAASFSGASSYVWEEFVASVWTAIVDGGAYAGQGTTTLTVTPTDTSLSGRQFRCRGVNENGSTSSASATLTVFAGAQVTTPIGPTSGAGVATGDLSTDRPLTTAGQFLVVELTDGTTTLYIAAKPATP